LGRRYEDLPPLSPIVNPDAVVEEEETVAALAMNPLSDDTPDVTEQSEPQQSIRSSNRLAKRSREEEAVASSALVMKRPHRAATIKTGTMLIGERQAVHKHFEVVDFLNNMMCT
jgi:hypothetical protein